MTVGSVKLQKHLAMERGDKKYYKYELVLPSGKVKEVGWEEGEDLEAEVRGEKLVLKPKRE
mgnify:CR=1 FL=1